MGGPMPEYAAGFQTLEAEVSVDGLPVEGELPPWLRGSLIRTGPARFEANGRSLNHWFDGQAMLHRFSFAERGSRVWLFDRGDGEVSGPFETDAAFAFHHVNAFERDGEVVVDMCVYDDAEIIRALYLERLRNPDPRIPPSRLERWRVDLSTRRVMRECVGDA